MVTSVLVGYVKERERQREGGAQAIPPEIYLGNIS